MKTASLLSCRLIFRCITKVTGRFASLLSQDDIREIYATLGVKDSSQLRG